MALTTTQQTEAYRFFAIAFGAAPGVEFMNQIAAAYEGGAQTKQIVNEFTKKSVFTNAYPLFLTNEQFADRLVNNVVGSSAADAAKVEAKADIVAALAGGATRGDVIFQVFTNLASLTGDAKWGNVAAKLANQVAVSRYYTETLLRSSTDVATLQAVLSGVSETTDVSAAALETRLNPPAAKSFVLTPNVDSGADFLGGAGADVYRSAHNATANANTLGALDVLDGAGGDDTLFVTNDNGANAYTLALAQISSIETISIRGSAAITADTSGSNVTGLTNLAVTQGTDVTLKAATTTDVNVSGATGTIDITAGKGATVTAGTAGKNITIAGVTAAVSVTDTDVGAANVKVNGGTNIAIAATGSTGGGANSLTVGDTKAPTGTVTITSAHTAVAGTNASLNNIAVTGGTTVSVTQTSDTSKAAADKTGSTLTQGTVSVTGGGATTSVTVAQASSISARAAVDAVAGVTETASVKFSAMTAGQTLVIAGLTFTASTSLTAAEAAAAFANLIVGTLPVAGDTQGAGLASKGTYTGVLTGWTTGAVSTDTVVFTSTTPSSNVADLTNGGTATATVTTTAGSAATAAVTGRLGVINGTVTINDAAAASITSVSVTGYGNGSNIGNTATLSKLSTLSLSNNGGATAGATDGSMTVNAKGVSTLNVTLNNIAGPVSLDGAGDNALKTLNVTTGATGTFGATVFGGAFALTANAVETMTVAGASSLDLTNSTIGALKSVTVSGAAGLRLPSTANTTLTSVNTTATTGAVSSSIDGSKATYTGGAGVDSVTLLTTAALTKAIDLGAGNDSLAFGTSAVANAVTGSTAAVNGGDGTDTLAMSVANAVALSAGKQTFYTNFERLSLYGGTADATVNLTNLGFTDFVTVTGTAAATTLTLGNTANSATVVSNAANAGTVVVSVPTAVDPTTDVLNLTLQLTTADRDHGTFTVANVETVNLTSTDASPTTSTGASSIQTNSVVLSANSATAINLGSSNAHTALTLTGSTKVTSIDGSSMTGNLTVTSLNTTSATTIRGGSGRDTLQMATGTTADVLSGGAGNDKLTANAGLGSMTGGTGNDLFVIGVASANVNSYSTITDFSSDDLIQISGISAFKSARVTLGDTAVFQDFANAAILALGAGESGWFQFGGNTYIVADLGGNGTAFTNGEDFIVKLNGLVDLTTATFNDTHDTIGI